MVGKCSRWESRSVDFSMSTYKYDTNVLDEQQNREMRAPRRYCLIHKPKFGRTSDEDNILLIQMLAPASIQRHTAVGSSVYFAFEGEGYSVINGKRFDCRKAICSLCPVGLPMSIGMGHFQIGRFFFLLTICL